jgi:L-threonylcarbamoyladenylate synthase
VSVDVAAETIRAGGVVVLPTDTVYGLAATPFQAAPVRALYALKGRGKEQPIALVAADLDTLFELLPELRGRAGVIVRALLPGPLTLVVPNPGRRFAWLTGGRDDAIGIRVPVLSGVAHVLLDRVRVVAATSANRPGDADPSRLEEVPTVILDGVDAVVDGGELPGTPSTVLDFSGDEPRVLREGAAPSGEALARAAAALA